MTVVSWTRRCWAAVIGGAFIGCLTGAAAGVPVAEATNSSAVIWLSFGAALGFVGGALSGYVAGDCE